MGSRGYIRAKLLCDVACHVSLRALCGERIKVVLFYEDAWEYNRSL